MEGTVDIGSGTIDGMCAWSRCVTRPGNVMVGFLKRNKPEKKISTGQNPPRREPRGGPESSFGITQEIIWAKKTMTCTLFHSIAGGGGEKGRESKAMCITNAGMSDI